MIRTTYLFSCKKTQHLAVTGEELKHMFVCEDRSEEYLITELLLHSWQRDEYLQF